MASHPDPEPELEDAVCPACGAPLIPEERLLRCPEHGLFFRYGPRLLVQIPNEREVGEDLLPWQTLV
jgi:hypothetical protein